MEKIRNGEDKGLETIYKTYNQRVHQIALRKGLDSETAEEIATAFFRSIKSKAAELIDTVEDPDGWVYELVDKMANNYKK